MSCRAAWARRQRAWRSPNHRLRGAIYPLATVTGPADGDSRSDTDHSLILREAASSGATTPTKEGKDYERKQQSPEPPERTRTDAGGS